MKKAEEEIEIKDMETALKMVGYTKHLLDECAKENAKLSLQVMNLEEDKNTLLQKLEWLREAFGDKTTNDYAMNEKGEGIPWSLSQFLDEFYKETGFIAPKIR